MVRVIVSESGTLSALVLVLGHVSLGPTVLCLWTSGIVIGVLVASKV